jgi:hypothetical protein
LGLVELLVLLLVVVIVLSLFYKGDPGFSIARVQSMVVFVILVLILFLLLQRLGVI